MEIKRRKQFNFEASDEFFVELKEVAKKTDIKPAQLVRQAVYKEIAELKRTHPKLQETVNA